MLGSVRQRPSTPWQNGHGLNDLSHSRKRDALFLSAVRAIAHSKSAVGPPSDFGEGFDTNTRARGTVGVWVTAAPVIKGTSEVAIELPAGGPFDRASSNQL